MVSFNKLNIYYIDPNTEDPFAISIHEDFLEAAN